MKLSASIIIFLLGVSVSSAEIQLRLQNVPDDLWSFAIETTRSDPNFERFQIDFGIIQEICNRGVWILYNEVNYGGTGRVEIVPYLNDTCVRTTSYFVGSIRKIERSEGNEIPSFILFENWNFGGEAIGTTVFENGVEDFGDFEPTSMISINSTVEFFEEPGYIGESYCIIPSELSCIDSACWAWQHFDTPIDISAYKSARIGCSQESILKSQRRQFFSAQKLRTVTV